MEWGCQRISPVLARTEGFTQLRGQRPLSTDAISWPTRRRRAGSNRAEADATCAVRMTLSKALEATVLAEKYGLGVFDLRETLQEAVAQAEGSTAR